MTKKKKSTTQSFEYMFGVFLKMIGYGKGTCGTSALSSVFYYRYDTNLARLKYFQKSGYVNSLYEPALKKSRKSSSIKYLN